MKNQRLFSGASKQTMRDAICRLDTVGGDDAKRIIAAIAEELDSRK